MKKINSFRLIIIIALTVLATPGCIRNNSETSHEAAGKLFEKSIKLLSIYTDSIHSASDSASVESLIHTYEYKINAVNFEFPPDTDLRLTEEENDSLIKMTDRLVCARKERLKALSELTNTNKTDSISIKE